MPILPSLSYEHNVAVGINYYGILVHVAPAVLKAPRQMRAVMRTVTAMMAVFCVGIPMLSPRWLCCSQVVLLAKVTRKQKPDVVTCASACGQGAMLQIE